MFLFSRQQPVEWHVLRKIRLRLKQRERYGTWICRPRSAATRLPRRKEFFLKHAELCGESPRPTDFCAIRRRHVDCLRCGG